MGSTKHLAAFAAKLREFMVASTSSEPCRAEQKDAFNRLALELFALQFCENVPYGKFCAARGAVPEAVRHWSHIPAVPADAFKDLKLTCLPEEGRTAVFHSSGTTGQRPSKHFHSLNSLRIYEDSLLRWFGIHVLTSFPPSLGSPPAIPDRCSWHPVILTPPPALAPHSSLVHMFETIRRALGAQQSVFAGEVDAEDGWSVDSEEALGLLNAGWRKACPAIILGTAFSFVHLLDYLAEHKARVRLPAGSRVMETGGYKGRSRAIPKAELHSLITARLGIPATHIVSEYGMSELSSQAYDLVVGASAGGGLSSTGPGPGQSAPFVQRQFYFPPWVRTEVVSPENGREVDDGETGLLRVFDLANVYSVMAIQTEDLAIRHGAAFELIGRHARAEPRGCSLREVER